MSVHADKRIPSLPEISDEIFKEIKETHKITDEQLSSLQFLFDRHFIKATQIVDQGGVFCFQAVKSHRKAFQVQGNQRSKDKYTVFPHHYCSCQSFFFDVVGKQDAVYCKHQLAVLLAEALGRTRLTTVSDLVVAEILQGLA